MRQQGINRLVMAFAAIALSACSGPSSAEVGIVSNKQEDTRADREFFDALEAEFIETSGKNFVEFAKGSAQLGNSAKFSLERQAVWLRAYPMVSVRLIASGDGDRRLARARGLAVRGHLIAFGVQAHQVPVVDEAPSTFRRVTTKLVPIQTALNE